MKLVVDASVAVKWILGNRPDETDVDRAGASLGGIMRIDLDRHLFDTLYHAVALEEGATLVTADEVHFAKARRLGNIELLADLAV